MNFSFPSLKFSEQTGRKNNVAKYFLEIGMDQGDIEQLIFLIGDRKKELGFVFFFFFFLGERLWSFLGVKKWRRRRYGEIWGGERHRIWFDRWTFFTKLNSCRVVIDISATEMMIKISINYVQNTKLFLCTFVMYLVLFEFVKLFIRFLW